MLEVRPTSLPEILILATRWHEDERGSFSEVYQQPRFNEAGIRVAFMQDNHAVSKKRGTVRGLHFQRAPAAQSKLVRVVRGAVFDVAVDIRPDSPHFGRWAGLELSAENRLQLFVPAGFAHGYLTLTDDSEVLYKVDEPYAPQHEGGILWNDPALGIAWPDLQGDPLIAPRDAALPKLAELAP